MANEASHHRRPTKPQWECWEEWFMKALTEEMGKKVLVANFLLFTLSSLAKLRLLFVWIHVSNTRATTDEKCCLFNYWARREQISFNFSLSNIKPVNGCYCMKVHTSATIRELCSSWQIWSCSFSFPKFESTLWETTMRQTKFQFRAVTKEEKGCGKTLANR